MNRASSAPKPAVQPLPGSTAADSGRPPPVKKEPRKSWAFIPANLEDFHLFPDEEEAADQEAQVKDEPDSALPLPKPELGVLSTHDVAAAVRKVSIERGDRCVIEHSSSAAGKH